MDMPDHQGFFYWGMGEVSPHKPKIHSFPHLEKSPQYTPPPPNFYSLPTKSQFPH